MGRSQNFRNGIDTLHHNTSPNFTNEKTVKPQENEKISQATDWAKIFAKAHLIKKLLSKLYKEPLKLNNKKKIQFKMGQTP